jgi:hypothetical protein
MPSLEEFLRTGHLGSIILGMGQNDVMTALGEPDDISAKSNPLILRYGCVQLVFWKSRGQQGHQLREIVIGFQPESQSVSGPLAFTDWKPGQPATEQDLTAFTQSIGYVPTHTVAGPSGRQLHFPSGVTVLFSEGLLHSIRLAQRETKEPTSAPLSDEREPGTSQIREMLQEAERALQAGAVRAALLIAWAGLEAVLRRAARRAGRQGKIGVQPAILLRELMSAGVLPASYHATLEELRQARLIAAHGLAPAPVDPDVVTRTIRMAKELLSSADK